MSLTFMLALLATSVSFAGDSLNTSGYNASASESQMLAFEGIKSNTVSMLQADKLSGEFIPLWAVAVVANVIARRYVAPYLIKKALPWLASAAGAGVVSNYINCGKWRCG